MKKIPRKIKHWAEEAYQSLEKAMVLFSEEYPSPTENEKMILVPYATPFAAMNRGIKGGEKLEQANAAVLENLRADLAAKEPDEPVIYSILFLLAYLDTTVSFGYISEGKSDEIMDYLAKNYEISIPA